MPPRVLRLVERSKFVLGTWTIGLFYPGGKDEAEKAVSLIATDFFRGGRPVLRCVVLVRDHDGGEAGKLHSDFITRMANLVRSAGKNFDVLQREPAVVRIGELAAAQILVGDPTVGTQAEHTVEDHILAFLEHQPARDPSVLAQVVEQELGISLTPKQLVLLSMVRDRYWSSAAGFYERVVNDVPTDTFQALGESVGLARVMDGLGA